MPVFNGARFLKESIESILSQTHSDLELIAVDDGSTDHTLDVLNSFNDRRLIVLKKNHSGVIDALNMGIARAKGEYFARMDCDDIALSGRLETQAACMKETGADVVGGRVRVFADKGDVRDGLKKYEAWLNGLGTHEEVIRNIFLENPLASPTLFMRLKTIRKIGGYDAGVHPDDYNLTLKCFAAGLKFHIADKVILEWRDHPERMSRTAPELADQRFFDIKAKYFKNLHSNPDRPFVIWGIGRNGKNLFKAFERAGFPIAGFTAEKKFIREKTLYDVPVLPWDKWPKRAFFILAVATRGAREAIQSELSSRRPAETADFTTFC